MQPFAFAYVFLVWTWLVRLGGPGLVLLGIADNSIIPLTGSMDVLTIWLAARHHEPWPYYALMATLGAVGLTLWRFRRSCSAKRAKRSNRRWPGRSRE